MVSAIKKRLAKFFSSKKQPEAAPSSQAPPKYITIYDGVTGQQVNPALEDSTEAGDSLSEREMTLIYDKNECPDCGGTIGWGPSASMHQNVACMGQGETPTSGCGARFNMSIDPQTFPVCDRLTHRNIFDMDGNLLVKHG